MGLLDRIKKMFFKEESIDSFNQSSNQSINQSSQSIKSIESINQSPNQSFNQSFQSEKTSIELEKESLKLGMAAGFISKTLIHMEELLDKITTNFPDRAWISSELRSQLSILEQKLDEHERKSQERLNILINLIHSLKEISPYLPQTYRSKLQKIVQEAEPHLTPKMQQLVETVKSRKEISYKELAVMLGISESALRGLLSLAIERGAPLQRFRIDGKGWVRYVESIQSPNQSQTQAQQSDFSNQINQQTLSLPSDNEQSPQ